MDESEHRPRDLPLLHPRRGVPRIRGIAAIEAGTRVGAFRVDRLIARGSVGSVYEATQLSLRRTVALRLIEAGHFTTPDELVRFDHQQRSAAALHHPNLVPCYEVGDWEGGRFIAMRLIRGRTLEELCEAGSSPAAGSLDPLTGALRAAHGAGLVHGRISDRNIIVEPDGTPYLADLGLARGGSREADEQALAAVSARLPVRAARPAASRARRALLIGSAVVVMPAVAVALALSGGEGGPESLAPPSSPANTAAVGSELAAAAVERLGCTAAPSSNTPACTLAQTRLDGAPAPVTVRRAGVIRSWAVRGASGDLALQVIRERNGRSFVAAFSQPERLLDSAPRAFPAEIGVRAGDTIGVRLAPGAAVGARSHPSSAIARWDGGLTAGPQPADASTPGLELMLRADIEFGLRPEGPRLLVGRQAASAPAGSPLVETPVILSGARGASALVVELAGGIAVDLSRGGRRLARLEVPDADPEGELLEVAQSCGSVGAHGFCLRWRNPDAELALEHEYRVRGTGSIELIG